MPEITVCPSCDDSGFVMKAERAYRCECRLRARAQKLLSAAHIPDRYRDCTWQQFETSLYGRRDALSHARIAARRLIENYPVEQTGMLLQGSIGVGKTHLAVAILQELISDKGAKGLFYDYRELLKAIQQSYNPENQTTEMEILSPVFAAEVLVIDELGATKPTEWVLDEIGMVLNRRYNSRKMTILTSNFALEAPENGQSRSTFRQEVLSDRVGARIASRIQEMCVTVRMEGEDLRQTRRAVNQR